MTRLALFLPGLDGLAALREGSAPVVVDTPAWNCIAARANRRADDAGYETALLREFGVAEIGIAALAVRHDLPDLAPEGVWLRADPVYLRADRDHLRFFDAHVLDLTREEAERLAGEIAAIYADLDWSLHVAAPDRWYLRIDAEPDIHTHAPSEVVGRVVDPYLPQGPDATRWHKLLTEMQMVLHMSEVNTQRERTGRLPVNSVWFWGNGPRPSVPRSTQDVYADEPLAAALGVAAGGKAGDLDEADTVIAAPRTDTVIADGSMRRPSLYADAVAWKSAREAVERRWLAPALAALRARRIDELVIHSDAGTQRILRRPHLWRFWRRMPT